MRRAIVSLDVLMPADLQVNLQGLYQIASSFFSAMPTLQSMLPLTRIWHANAKAKN
jgi:hypothetical protein